MDHLEVGGEAGEHLDLQLALGESLHGVHADLDQAADERREDCLLEQPDVAAHQRGEEILRLRHGDPGDADLDDDLSKISVKYAKILQNIRQISLNFSQNFVPARRARRSSSRRTA